MPFLAPLAGGVLGAISGASGKKETMTQRSGLDLAPAGVAEGIYGRTARGSLQELSGLTQAGPGQQDVTNSLGATGSLADMLDQLSKTGGLPSQQDVASGQAVADNIFAPRKTALDQSFIKQNTDAQRLSASLGRSVDDPILQAKLRTGFMQQSDMLNAEKGAYGGQIAMSLPGQRVQYAGQRADILGNLASQAFSNRSALLGLGSNLQNLDRNFRVQTADRYSSGESTQGGGLSGAISGGIGGLGMGISLMNQFGAGGTGGGSPFGGGNSSAPMSTDNPVAGNTPQDYGYHASSMTASAPWMGGGASRSVGSAGPSYGPQTFNLGSLGGTRYGDVPSGFGGNNFASNFLSPNRTNF